MAGSLASGAFVNASVISYNFNRNGDEPFASTVAAGAVSVTNWNQATPQANNPSGTNVALVDDTGASVATTITYSAGNTWAQGGASADGNVSVLKGYLDDNNATVTFNNITYNKYDVYVYGIGDGGAGSTLGTYTINDGVAPPLTYSYLRASSLPTDGSGTLIEGNATTQGHYFKISGLTGSSFNLVSDSNRGNGRGPIAGIQIVQVPEPSSSILIVSFAGAMLLRRRRS
ncbi:PEP-CTERM sorting domain-containing protein [Oceaniferula spumae]|uniref:PEP-CTERM sorting domain-containing protein n=1 Tax=Oceaniferula spumae TaxID=2979115 RepID=UPI003F4EC99C